MSQVLNVPRRFSEHLRAKELREDLRGQNIRVNENAKILSKQASILKLLREVSSAAPNHVGVTDITGSLNLILINGILTDPWYSRKSGQDLEKWKPIFPQHVFG